MTTNQSRGGPNPVPAPAKSTLLLAISLGIVAAILNVVYLANARGSAIRIYTARVPVYAGHPISRNQLNDPPLTLYSPNLDALSKLIVNDANFDIYAKIPLAENLMPGQIVLKSAFQFGAGTGIRDHLNPGQEAVSIPVNRQTAVGCAIQPTNLVDIFAKSGTGPSSHTESDPYAPLVTGALVLAVDGDTLVVSDRGDRECNTVTVAVSSQDSHQLVNFVQNGTGRVYLTLPAR